MNYPTDHRADTSVIIEMSIFSLWSSLSGLNYLCDDLYARLLTEKIHGSSTVSRHLMCFESLFKLQFSSDENYVIGAVASKYETLDLF